MELYHQNSGIMTLIYKMFMHVMYNIILNKIILKFQIFGSVIDVFIIFVIFSKNLIFTLKIIFENFKFNMIFYQKYRTIMINLYKYMKIYNIILTKFYKVIINIINNLYNICKVLINRN